MTNPTEFSDDALQRFLAEKVNIVFSGAEILTLKDLEITCYNELGLFYADEANQEIGFAPWVGIAYIFKSATKSDNTTEAK